MISEVYNLSDECQSCNNHSIHVVLLEQWIWAICDVMFETDQQGLKKKAVQSGRLIPCVREWYPARAPYFTHV